MRAVTLISAVMFLALTISVIALVYHMGMPVIDKIQKKAIFTKMKGQMAYLDEKIQEVASEGNHSRRIIDLNIPAGRLGIDRNANAVIWEMPSKEAIIFPRTAEFSGNMIAGINLNTSLHSSEYNGIPAYKVENSHTIVYFRKIGSRQEPETCSIGNLFLAAYQKDLKQWLPIESLNISIDNNPLSKTGKCYTEAERFGDYLPYGRVLIHMNSPYINYTISFTLESGTDFLRIAGSL